MNHEWNATAVHALTGAAKAALVFAILYTANEILSSPLLQGDIKSLMAQNSDQGVCEDIFAKGFQGTAACNEYGWESISVPGLDPSKYSLLLDESSGRRCTAVLTEAGQKLIPLSENCHEVWKIVGDKATIWWDLDAKAWY